MNLNKATYFWDSNRTGNIGVNIVKSLLESKFDIIDVQRAKEYRDKEIDLLCLINGITAEKIEVKTDTYWKSGNLFFETENNGKPSWIYNSEADYIYYIFPCQIMYKIRLDEFRPWFLEYENEYRIVKSKTTDSNGELWYYNYGRLIPRNDIENLGFIQITNLN